MLSKKDLLLPLTILAIFILSTVYIFLFFGKDFIDYSKIKFQGVTGTAKIIKKTSDPYSFLLIHQMDSNNNSCKVTVSKSTYDSYKTGNQIKVVYNKANPEFCTLPYSLNFNYLLSLSLILLGLFFLIVSIGFAFYIKNSFRRPIDKNSLRLTTNLNINQTEVKCPKCNNNMVEGYLPTIGGVSWRNIDEPVGIPTILSGLPGTTYWVRRPKLHGYHCKNCQIVTFKYGSDTKN